MGNFGSFSDLSSLFTKLSQSLGKRPKTWTGTKAEWDQMTAEQKAVYDGWYVNFTDDAEEGGGGGGHIIEDSEGTELTQRDTLKVGGSLIAEDDPTNEKTIITDGMEEIDYEDWIALTPQEQAAIPKALITNAPEFSAGGADVFITAAVSCAVAATSCTITDSHIHTTSLIDVYCQNTSGLLTPLAGVAVTEGQAVITFAALEEATDMVLLIHNLAS